jgi:alkylhydroperoxidase/carboxymuconolactone decarboxylase family protein YurZ
MCAPTDSGWRTISFSLRWPLECREELVDQGVGVAGVERRVADEQAVVDRAVERVDRHADVEVGPQFAALDPAREDRTGLRTPAGDEAVAYGEIYQRPVLDLRQRQLITISALTTLGGAEPQLEVHINAGLNVGLSAREVVEAILHCIPYTGFPRVLNAIFVAKRVFEERAVDPLNDNA